MNFPGNFMCIGRVDVAALRQLVREIPEAQWQGESFRQQRYEVHRDTETIGLVFDLDFRHTMPTRLPALEAFEPSMRPALMQVADYYEDSPKGQMLLAESETGLGYFIRANLVRMPSGGEITEHTDNKFSLVHSHRVHLPIISNDEVLFTVGSESINMQEGELYEINNRRMHSVRNSGPAGCVHLIMDYVLPGEKCCCGEKHHPRTACNPHACQETDHLRVACVCFPEDR